jgi:hypothetical protein
MRCTYCKRPISSGVEKTKMIVSYQQEDGSTSIFGYLMADGPISSATGRLLQAWHHKCYHIVRKRVARGGQVTGRAAAGVIPDAYDPMAQQDTTTPGSDRAVRRMQDLRDFATQRGMGFGDTALSEAYQAHLNGGPYEHVHVLPVNIHQLLAHLHYAHGIQEPGSGMQFTHSALHAGAAKDRLNASKEDLEPTPEHPIDWRTQTTVEISDLG